MSERRHRSAKSNWFVLKGSVETMDAELLEAVIHASQPFVARSCCERCSIASGVNRQTATKGAASGSQSNACVS